MGVHRQTVALLVLALKVFASSGQSCGTATSYTECEYGYATLAPLTCTAGGASTLPVILMSGGMMNQSGYCAVLNSFGTVQMSMTPMTVTDAVTTTINEAFSTCAAKTAAECTGDCACDGAGSCVLKRSKLYEHLGITDSNSYLPYSTLCDYIGTETDCNADSKCFWDKEACSGSRRLDNNGLHFGKSIRSLVESILDANTADSTARRLGGHRSRPYCSMRQSNTFAKCAATTVSDCKTYTSPSYCDADANCREGGVKAANAISDADMVNVLSAECKAGMMSTDLSSPPCNANYEECAYESTMTSGEVKCSGDDTECNSDTVKAIQNMVAAAMNQGGSSTEKWCVPKACSESDLAAYLKKKHEQMKLEEACKNFMNMPLCKAQLGLVATGSMSLTCPSHSGAVTEALSLATGSQASSGGDDASGAFATHVASVVALLTFMTL